MFQLTVIHPRVPTPKSSVAVPTETALPVAALEKTVKPMHALMSHHHVDERPAQTLVDHYLEATIADRAPTVITGGSKLYTRTV